MTLLRHIVQDVFVSSMTPHQRSTQMLQRWPWHTIGFVTAVLLIYPWLAIFFHSIPFPRVSGACFLAWLFGSMAFSALAGWRASRWWYFVSACFVVNLVLLWVGEFLFERH